MKFKIAQISLLFCLLSRLCIVAANEDKVNGRIELHLEKENYLYGEAIWIKIKFINHGSLGPNSAALGHYLDLFDAEGNDIMGSIEPSIHGPYISLSQNDTVTAGGELLQSYGKPRRYTGIEKSGRRSLAPGQYYLQYTVGKIVSEKQRFSISSPKGDDSLAFELFDECSKALAKSYSNSIQKSQLERTADLTNYQAAMDTLLNSYPNHIYAQCEIYHFLTNPKTSSLELFKRNNITDRYHKYYELYPNSSLTEAVLEHEYFYYVSTMGHQNAVSTIKQLAQEFPNIQIKRAVRNILNRQYYASSGK